jgi:D-3-phosphoglycerate dehydrogenase
MEDISKLVKGQKPRFVVNKEVLERPEFKAWLAGIQQ